MHFDCQSQSCLVINKAGLAAKRRIDLQERFAHFYVNLKVTYMLDVKAQHFNYPINLDDQRNCFLNCFLSSNTHLDMAQKKDTFFC